MQITMRSISIPSLTMLSRSGFPLRIRLDASDLSAGRPTCMRRTNRFTSISPVNEKDRMILTELYAASSSSLILYGNGRIYSDGSRVKGSLYATAAASDGTTLLGWNTKPDSSGDSYPVGWWNRTQDVADNSPSRLYAQWKDSEAELPPIQRSFQPSRLPLRRPPHRPLPPLRAPTGSMRTCSS